MSSSSRSHFGNAPKALRANGLLCCFSLAFTAPILIDRAPCLHKSCRGDHWSSARWIHLFSGRAMHAPTFFCSLVRWNESSINPNFSSPPWQNKIKKLFGVVGPQIAAGAIEWMSVQMKNYVYNLCAKSSWGAWGSFFQEVPHKRVLSPINQNLNRQKPNSN